MKVFHCTHCGQRVFFENVTCVNCNHVLAFLPDQRDMAALEAAPPGQSGEELWRSLASVQNAATGTALYRLCANYRNLSVCNWAVPAADPGQLCRSCRLTRIIPDLSSAENTTAWGKIETAKRRLVYGLLVLELPLEDRASDPQHGLAYEFRADLPQADEAVLTGHDAGVITLNIAEADDAEREKRRVSLHEPYRTLLGHLRHEVGHYYWDVLIQASPHLAEFRALFGDEQAEYGAALQRHYAQGPPADWSDRFISAYASSHPWEDWAETWAHYLHMIDALETAASSGLTIDPRSAPGGFSAALIAGRDLRRVPFESLLDNWLALTYVLNNLNRSLGLQDGYPFVLPPPAIDKLRFVHQIISMLPRAVFPTPGTTPHLFGNAPAQGVGFGFPSPTPA